MENLPACRDALGLSRHEIVHLVRNGLEAAFVTEKERPDLVAQLDAYVAAHPCVPAPASAGDWR
jgi:adenosine deaminase